MKAANHSAILTSELFGWISVSKKRNRRILFIARNICTRCHAFQWRMIHAIRQKEEMKCQTTTCTLISNTYEHFFVDVVCWTEMRANSVANQHLTGWINSQWKQKRRCEKPNQSETIPIVIWAVSCAPPSTKQMSIQKFDDRLKSQMNGISNFLLSNVHKSVIFASHAIHFFLTPQSYISILDFSSDSCLVLVYSISTGCFFKISTQADFEFKRFHVIWIDLVEECHLHSVNDDVDEYWGEWIADRSSANVQPNLLFKTSINAQNHTYIYDLNSG